MDFVTGLPLSKGCSMILVVNVDKFSKVIHLWELDSGFIAYKVDELFVSIHFFGLIFSSSVVLCYV